MPQRRFAAEGDGRTRVSFSGGQRYRLEYLQHSGGEFKHDFAMAMAWGWSSAKASRIKGIRQGVNAPQYGGSGRGDSLRRVAGADTAGVFA